MTSELERVVALEGANVVQIYGRPPFVITRGEGMTVYDSEGRAYLDFVAGIAVNSTSPAGTSTDTPFWFKLQSSTTSNSCPC